MEEKLERKIDKFVEKIHPVYEFLKWDWHDEGIPTKEQIREKLVRLIVDSQKENCLGIKTGGLFVNRRNDEGNIDFVFGMEITGGSFYSDEVKSAPTTL